jgi:hypothetical protein
MGSSHDRGPQGSAVLEGDVGRSRVLRRKLTGAPAAATRVQKVTDPTSLVGEQGGAATQEKDRGVVAEVRLQLNASSPRRLFARRQ